MTTSFLTTRRLAILGALAGAFASAYLLVDYLGGPSICLTGAGCEEVRSSVFAYPLGIPLPAAGLAFYTLAVAGLLMPADRRIGGAPIPFLLVGWAGLGVAVMTGLTAVEVLVIHALCGWCLVSALASLVLAAGAVGWARGHARPDAAVPSRRTRRARQLDAHRHEEERGVARFTAISGAALSVLLVGLLAVSGLASGQPGFAGGPAGASARSQLGEGPVQVVVFSDFACPACARVAPWLEQLAGDGSATLVYRYFPLAGVHPNAVAAARAAEAAHRQGAFWAYADQLFASQSTWARMGSEQAAAAFEAIAADIDLDLARWRSDLAAAASSVQMDADEAERLGLRGTPSIFIDGKLYQGPLSQEDLATAVRSAS
jgi:protein-disulfide isomerase/uncharacterized membrane protein